MANWNRVIREIVSSGMTQAQIAEFSGLSQANVSELMAGRYKDTRYEIGNRLMFLHFERVTNIAESEKIKVRSRRRTKAELHSVKTAA